MQLSGIHDRAAIRRTMDCARCKTLDCYTKGKDCTGDKGGIAELYKNDPQALAIMGAAAELEAEGYMMLPRVQEVILFGKKWATGIWAWPFAQGCTARRGCWRSCLPRTSR